MPSMGLRGYQSTGAKVGIFRERARGEGEFFLQAGGRGIVLIDIHVDDNPIKTAYLRHISLLLRLVGYKYTKYI